MSSTQGGPGPGPSRDSSVQNKKDARFVRRAVSPGHLSDPRTLSATSALTVLTAARPATGARARDKFIPLPDANRQSQVVPEEPKEELAVDEPESEPAVAQKRGRITVITVAESFNRKALEAALQEVASGSAVLSSVARLPGSAIPGPAQTGAPAAGASTGATSPPVLPSPTGTPPLPATPGASRPASFVITPSEGDASTAAAAAVGATNDGFGLPSGPALGPGGGAAAAGAGGLGGPGEPPNTSSALVPASGSPRVATAVTMKVTAYPEVIFIRTAHGEAVEAPGEVFFFDYGVVAFWGMTEAQEQALLKAVVKAHPGVAVELLDDEEKQVEEMLFVYSRDSPPSIKNDTITIDIRQAGDHQVKMAISHALAQSSKLSMFEERMMGLVEEVRDIPAEMAERGCISMSRRNVACIMGKVFLLKAAVNLTATMLDTPEFFWRAPDHLQTLYERACAYLDLRTRLELLNTRFLVLQRMLDIWSDHSAHQNLARLDVIIVLLILIEVVMAAMEVVGFLLRRRGWTWSGPRLGQLVWRLAGWHTGGMDAGARMESFGSLGLAAGEL